MKRKEEELSKSEEEKEEREKELRREKELEVKRREGEKRKQELEKQEQIELENKRSLEEEARKTKLREEKRKAGDAALMDKMFEGQNLLPAHSVTFGKEAKDYMERFAADVSKIKTDPSLKIKYDNEYRELKGTYEISKQINKKYLQISKRITFGEKFSEEDSKF